jgi:hypothetical protein
MKAAAVLGALLAARVELLVAGPDEPVSVGARR